MVLDRCEVSLLTNVTKDASHLLKPNVATAKSETKNQKPNLATAHIGRNYYILI
jgi:hypothetical protein